VSDSLADVRPSPERECINSEIALVNLVQSVMGFCLVAAR